MRMPSMVGEGSEKSSMWRHPVIFPTPCVSIFEIVWVMPWYSASRLMAQFDILVDIGVIYSHRLVSRLRLPYFHVLNFLLIYIIEPGLWWNSDNFRVPLALVGWEQLFQHMQGTGHDTQYIIPKVLKLRREERRQWPHLSLLMPTFNLNQNNPSHFK